MYDFTCIRTDAYTTTTLASSFKPVTSDLTIGNSFTWEFKLR